MRGLRKRGRLFLVGGMGYSLLEIGWRKHTHWTMAAAGGLCFSLFYDLCGKMTGRSRWEKSVAGSTVITGVEFLAGCLINRRLGWSVWDYSRLPGNVMGQICLPFTFLWFLLCLPVTALCDELHRREGRCTLSQAVVR